MVRTASVRAKAGELFVEAFFFVMLFATPRLMAGIQGTGCCLSLTGLRAHARDAATNCFLFWTTPNRKHFPKPGTQLRRERQGFLTLIGKFLQEFIGLVLERTWNFIEISHL